MYIQKGPWLYLHSWIPISIKVFDRQVNIGNILGCCFKHLLYKFHFGKNEKKTVYIYYTYYMSIIKFFIVDWAFGVNDFEEPTNRFHHQNKIWRSVYGSGIRNGQDNPWCDIPLNFSPCTIFPKRQNKSIKVQGHRSLYATNPCWHSLDMSAQVASGDHFFASCPCPEHQKNIKVPER